MKAGLVEDLVGGRLGCLKAWLVKGFVGWVQVWEKCTSSIRFVQNSVQNSAQFDIRLHLAILAQFKIRYADEFDICMGLFLRP